MEEKKKSKISVSTILLIIALVVIIGMGCYIYIEKTNSANEITTLETKANLLQSTIDSLQGKIDSISNTISGTTNSTDKYSDSDVDKIAKALFEKGSLKIRETEYSDYYMYEPAEPLTEKTIYGLQYQKRNFKYSDVENEYSTIFTDEALRNVLDRRFAQVDGYLYISYGGATGWDVSNIRLSRLSESDDEIEYLIKYNDVEINDSVSEDQTCNMTIKLINGNYRISETNYCNLDRRD